MKIKAYHSTTDTGLKRNYLDRWHTFSQVNDNTYTADGQEVEKTSLLVVDPTATLGIAAASGGISALTGTALLKQALTADVSKVRIAGVTYLVSTGAAAGAAVTGASIYVGSTAITASASLAAGSRVVVTQGLEIQTQSRTKTLNNVTIKAHGINIYDNFPVAFFNNYTGYHYGGPNMNVAQDSGALFVPFCLYPGTYQPSGHINVSRAREFYLNWDSSVIATGTEGTLVVIASAINFLLISDGSAVLRYST
jgi:hypothetical protein